MGIKQEIYNMIDYYTRKIDCGDSQDPNLAVCNANSIAEKFGLDRSSISQYMNELVNEGKLIKVKGKPVLFLSKAAIEQKFKLRLYKKDLIIDNIKDLFKDEGKNRWNANMDNSYYFGSSMTDIIKQAKVALHYPPNGLPVMLLGETGVGKSHFAKMMYQYAYKMNIIEPEGKFVEFNCADYAYNPQLILSQLFGYVKGSFTGANEDKPGLIDIANGGMLFLDEIHRMPPEGQEMLFYLIDYGLYRRVGETQIERKANPIIVVATTENPDSVLLKTFTRRIPIILNIPPVRKRSINEKINLIYILFYEEAKRINKKISITSDVIELLLQHNWPGNIGQLKNEIKILCGNGYVNSIDSDADYIFITSKILSDSFKKQSTTMREYSSNFDNVFIPNPIIISPDDNKMMTVLETGLDLYYILDAQNRYCLANGYSKDSINNTLIENIDKYFRFYINTFKKENEDKKENLFEFINQEIIKVSNNYFRELKERYNINLPLHFAIPFAYQLKLLSDNLKTVESLELSQNEFNRSKYYSEMEKVHILEKIIKNDLNYEITMGGKMLLCIFQYYLMNITNRKGSVGVLIMAHGNGVASQIAKVTNYLIGHDFVHYIDIPFEQTLDEIAEKTINMVKKIDKGEGVLILVDMGSLNDIGKQVKDITGVNVKIIDGVNTVMTLEAAQLSYRSNLSLNDIYYELKSSKNKGFSNSSPGFYIVKDLIVLTVCSSGKGIAVNLKNMIEKMFELPDNIKIIAIDSCSVEQINELVEKNFSSKEIIAIVGSIKPYNIGAPFISLEEMVFGDGILQLENILLPYGVLLKYKEGGGTYEYHINSQDNKLSVFKNIIIETLRVYHLNYLDAEKVVEIIFPVINEMEQVLNLTFSKSTKVNLIIHIAILIERLLFDFGNDYKSGSDANKHSDIYPKGMEGCFRKLEDNFNIVIPDNEKDNIMEIIDYGIKFKKQTVQIE